MARPKTFDQNAALNAAIRVFSQGGYEGTSAGDLVNEMRIGRQSLYDTFGDKWRLYLAALARYVDESVRVQLDALRAPARALDGIAAHIAVVVEDAVAQPVPSCLGVSATCEFGRREAEVKAVTDGASHRLQGALASRVVEGQSQGDIDVTVIPEEAAAFVLATLVGIKVSARAGAAPERLRSMGAFALRSLR